MTRQRARPTRIIELAGLSGTGKTTLADAFAAGAPVGTRVGVRARFTGALRRPAYFALMVRDARRWRSLYRILRTAMPGGAARRRLRMYIKHLWRRRQQIRRSDIALVVEDEAFATWLARDLLRCPGLEQWLTANIDVFYPRRVGRHHADYVLVTVHCGELLRTQRVHRRRLEKGPAYARAEYERYGTFASRQPAIERVNALLQERGLVARVDEPERQMALAREPLAAYR